MTTLERVQAILAKEYSLAPETITPESKLEALGLDSLDLIELLFEVEEQFAIRVPQDGAAALKMASVQDIVDSIDQVLAEQGATPSDGQ
jgi:Acyl carrier protein